MQQGQVQEYPITEKTVPISRAELASKVIGNNSLGQEVTTFTNGQEKVFGDWDYSSYEMAPITYKGVDGTIDGVVINVQTDTESKLVIIATNAAGKPEARQIELGRSFDGNITTIDNRIAIRTLEGSVIIVEVQGDHAKVTEIGDQTHQFDGKGLFAYMNPKIENKTRNESFITYGDTSYSVIWLDKSTGEVHIDQYQTPVVHEEQNTIEIMGVDAQGNIYRFELQLISPAAGRQVLYFGKGAAYEGATVSAAPVNVPSQVQAGGYTYEISQFLKRTRLNDKMLTAFVENSGLFFRFSLDDRKPYLDFLRFYGTQTTERSSRTTPDQARSNILQGGRHILLTVDGTQYLLTTSADYGPGHLYPISATGEIGDPLPLDPNPANDLSINAAVNHVDMICRLANGTTMFLRMGGYNDGTGIQPTLVSFAAPGEVSHPLFPHHVYLPTAHGPAMPPDVRSATTSEASGTKLRPVKSRGTHRDPFTDKLVRDNDGSPVH